MRRSCFYSTQKFNCFAIFKKYFQYFWYSLGFNGSIYLGQILHCWFVPKVVTTQSFMNSRLKNNLDAVQIICCKFIGPTFFQSTKHYLLMQILISINAYMLICLLQPHFLLLRYNLIKIFKNMINSILEWFFDMKIM